MAASLRSIQGKIAEIRICLDPEKPEAERTNDDYFTLWYHQHSLTAANEKIANAASKDGRELEGLVELCLPVFKKWDLKAGASDEQMEELEAAHASGNPERIRAIEADIAATEELQSPIELTREGLSTVPSSVLMLILDQINAARRPNTNGTEPQ